MSLVKKIDELHQKLSNEPLSYIIQLLMPISLELKDYECYCILYTLNMPLYGKVDYGIMNDLDKLLYNEGLDNEQIKTLRENSLERILSIRAIDESGEKCSISSIKEIENNIKNYEEMVNIVTVPDGLTPIDLYFRSETAKSEKLTIIQKKSDLEHILAKVEAFVTAKLAEYRSKAVHIERKMLVENSIKNTKNIFIIHGHAEKELLNLEKIIKEEFDLNPIILKDKPNNGMTIIEKFENYANNCSYAVALFTPDDIINNNDQIYFQARPNVIFELGWFYSHLGRSRVIIIEKVGENSKIFSDLQGIMRIQFKEDIQECFLQIKKELQSVGII